METTREIGRTGVRVPPIAFGTAALGDIPENYGYGVDEARAIATIRAVLERPGAFLDTSRNYGLGRSEARIGEAAREMGGWPAEAVISTKLDRDMDTGRFDADQARRSLEESLEALGVERVHVLHLHDPEYAADLSEVTREGGALDALMRMKEEGLTRAVGLAAGRTDVMIPILRDWDFDALITHNRFTLVNRHAEEMIALATERGVSVFNAAPYATGALAKGTATCKRYVYRDATPKTLAPVVRVEEVCARHGVPPGAAALQFSLREPRVTATICGVSRPERVAQTLEWAAFPIPEEAWAELLALPFTTRDPERDRDHEPG